MKTIILKVVFMALITLGLNGCYTIIWSPDSQLPTEDNSVTNIYYGDNYYGDYYYFYDTPWWWDYSYTPPATGVTYPKRDEGTQTLRGDLGDRGNPPRIIDVQPPSRDANPPSTGNSGSTGNNGSSTETVRSSSSSSSNSSGRESSSSGSVRNNNGGRSSGGRK